MSCEPVMEYGQNLAFPFSGQFADGEVLPRYVFLTPTTISRGIAYSLSALALPLGSGVMHFYKGEPGQGGVEVIQLLIGGSVWPELVFLNGSVDFNINDLLVPVAPSPALAGLTDLTVTFGTPQPTW